MNNKKFNNPEFQIVTTTYNRTKYLKECLESVNNQTYSNYEHIIVDGYSTDGTFEIVQKYKQENSNKHITILQRKPKGIYDAINFGIENGTGKWINILNSDDYYQNPNVLKHIHEISTKNPNSQWIQGPRAFDFYGLKYKTYKPPREFPNKIFKFLCQNIPESISHQSAFIHKDLYDKYGLYSTKYKYCSDFKFFLTLKESGEEYTFTDEYLAVNRAHANSATLAWGQGYMNWKPEVEAILEEHSKKIVTNNT